MFLCSSATAQCMYPTVMIPKGKQTESQNKNQKTTGFLKLQSHENCDLCYVL